MIFLMVTLFDILDMINMQYSSEVWILVKELNAITQACIKLIKDGSEYSASEKKETLYF